MTALQTQTSPLPAPPLPRSGHLRAYWRAPSSQSALALALVRSAQTHPGLVLAIARDSQQAQALEADLRFFATSSDGAELEIPILHFADWETLPYDQFSPHPDIISQRISALNRLPSTQRGVLVAPVATLMQRLCPTDYIASHSLLLSRGQKLDLVLEKRRLQAAGYRNVPQVLDPGDFAVRGALLDLYPMGSAQPYRIELFDDAIDTLRSFDPDTQRSLQTVDSIRLLPAHEFPLGARATAGVREALRERFDIDPRRSALYQDLTEGTAPAGIEYYLPLFFEHTATLFDYLAPDTLPVLTVDAVSAADAFWAQTGERYEQRRHDIERPLLAPVELYLSPQGLREQLNGYRHIDVVAASDARHSKASALGDTPVPDLPLAQKSDTNAAALHGFLQTYPGRVLIAADSAGRREALLDVLAAADLKPEVIDDWPTFVGSTATANAAAPTRFAITVAALDNGFGISDPPLAVLTERQLYPERAAHARKRRRENRDAESIVRDLSELSIGAPIVHEDHGVGRYQGLVTLKAGGSANEYLQIEYAKGDKLYVPVAQLQLVSRYSGASPDTAPLHALGGEQWEKAKRKAAERVRDVAAELLEIQARRQARKGLALPLDRSMYEPFAASFPFEETPDQQLAIEAVLRDLAAPQPMDRVVCGDVGFGKTEVAVRAAFVAATAGKQVALLVPTTLLAQQHGQSFRDRFANWPIRVEIISRFRTLKEIKAVLQQVAEGRVDVVVGTHRLLQADVKFKDLGLVIVDEEQRFGVRQKEALKKLRAEVNLLTLTATPIPRTLNMAMAGLRDLSLIGTPPAHRLAVKTFITPWDGALLREALQRELARGGQMYFLHNEVDSIERMGRELAELVPEARIRIGHGQMPERELEQVMLDFQRQRFNVLLCTTIIESGIDIPNANTIIINRADRFGLAQLHQLRGRVGRSHHRAYAYLVVPDMRALTSDAEKRLQAIASMEELGAGFTLATHDLEIRGAGELLGDEQSGQMTEIGFSLYTELLERAVRSIRSGKLPGLEDDPADRHGAEIELHLPALIPESYLDDVHARLTLYKRIASARHLDALRDLQSEIVDRFGVLPAQTRNLFAITELKLAATPLGIRKLDLGPKGGRVLFAPKPDIDPMAVINLIQKQPQHYALDGPEKLRIKLELEDPAARLAAARGLLMLLQRS